MDLVKEGEERRLAALERVVEAVSGEREPSGLPVTMLLTAVAALTAAVVGALWLLT